MRQRDLSFGYRLFKGYVRKLVHGLYYKDVYYLNRENIPPAGTPMLMVSNHQNSLNDALGLIMCTDDRKTYAITRADIFNVSPLLSKFLYWLGLLPSFRASKDGLDSLNQNDKTFRIAEDIVLEGKPVVIYPEAGHQNRRWLGKFSYGYTRLAFEAAERGNFEKEIFILPTCNHYSNYFGLRGSMLVKIGTPVSLAPYYELYKTKPRTAQRKVNEEVRSQVDSMMLNIEDTEHYEAIDFLREGSFGKEWAARLGKNPAYLPDKLDADKKLVASLKERGESVHGLLGEVDAFARKLLSEHVSEADLDRNPSVFGTVLSVVALVLLLPLALFCLWPSLISWCVPAYFTKKVGDNMLEGSFIIGLNAVVILPLCGLVTILVEGLTIGFAWGVAHSLILPLLCVFEWYYCSFAKRVVQRMFFARACANGTMEALKAKRDSLYGNLRSELNIN